MYFVHTQYSIARPSSLGTRLGCSLGTGLRQLM